MSTPVTPGAAAPADAVPLRTGLPTGAGGPIGQENAGTWSQLEQQQAFAAAGSLIAPPAAAPAAPAAPAPSSGS